MIVRFVKPEMQMSASSPAAADTSARASTNSATRATRREMDSAPRTESQNAEEWTSECMFDCYND